MAPYTYLAKEFNHDQKWHLGDGFILLVILQCHYTSYVKAYLRIINYYLISKDCIKFWSEKNLANCFNDRCFDSFSRSNLRFTNNNLKGITDRDELLTFFRRKSWNWKH